MKFEIYYTLIELVKFRFNRDNIILMNKKLLLAPPPTTPASHEIITLAPEEKTAAMAISRSASFILIGFVSTTLVIFALGRIFNTGRFLHMNIELALLGAHLCLIPDVTGNEVNTSTTDYLYQVYFF